MCPGLHRGLCSSRRNQARFDLPPEEKVDIGRTDNRFASPLATRITVNAPETFAGFRPCVEAFLRPMAGSDILIIIPARMAATRLPGKPLADIAGEPMIVHVMRRARAAAIGEVVVATDSEAVAASVEKAGGCAIMTRADHVSGSDRIFEALAAGDPSPP